MRVFIQLWPSSSSSMAFCVVMGPLFPWTYGWMTRDEPGHRRADPRCSGWSPVESLIYSKSIGDTNKGRSLLPGCLIHQAEINCIIEGGLWFHFHLPTTHCSPPPPSAARNIRLITRTIPECRLNRIAQRRWRGDSKSFVWPGRGRRQ